MRSKSILSKPPKPNCVESEKPTQEQTSTSTTTNEGFHYSINLDRYGSLSTEASIEDAALELLARQAASTRRSLHPPGLAPLPDFPLPPLEQGRRRRNEQGKQHQHSRDQIDRHLHDKPQRYSKEYSRRRQTETKGDRRWTAHSDSVFAESTHQQRRRCTGEWEILRAFSRPPLPPPPPPPSISPLLRSTIIAAITSLYDDCLKPTFVELKRRLQEYNISPRLLRDLPTICLALDQDLIVDVKAKEVYLIQEPPHFPGFVDAKDPLNPFGCCEWSDFIDYVSRLMQVSNWSDEELAAVETKMNRMLKARPEDGSEDSTAASNNNAENSLHYQFQGGRYGMASKMRTDWRLQSPRLREMALGHLCHLVQLSIAAGIMQYENNSLLFHSILQPRATCLRISAAFAQSDIEPERLATRREAIRDVAVVQEALHRILKEYPDGILLSQLKFKFESQLPSRLCQSVFGCTRLSNLLQLPTFQEVCRLIADGQGRVIAQSVEYLMPPNTKLLHRDYDNQILSHDGRPLPSIERCPRCRKPSNGSYVFCRAVCGFAEDDNEDVANSLSFVPPCRKTLQLERDSLSEECLQDHPEVVHSIVQLVGCL